jgi:hypothetical protein
MSGISNYTLNQKISNLQAQIQSVTLDAVLTSGNDAGGQSITNLNDVALTTINGLPPAGAENLQQTLTIGNNAGSNDIDMNNQDILNVNNIDLTTINGSAYPPTSSADTTLEDFDTNTNNSAVLGLNIRFNETGSGSSTYYTSSAFAGTYVAGVVGRSGLIQLNSGGSSGQETMLLTNTIYSIYNLEQVVIGFIPLANENFSITPVPAGNIRQHFGISATAQQLGTATTNSILWRLSSPSSTIPTWQFVINNVVQYTSTLGDLTSKWCRATFDITEPTAGNYSVSTTLVNLTDGTTETTSAFPLVAGDFSGFKPQTQGLLMVSGTDNNTNKYFGVDYVQTKLKLFPIGGGNTLAFR